MSLEKIIRVTKTRKMFVHAAHLFALFTRTFTDVTPFTRSCLFFSGLGRSSYVLTPSRKEFLESRVLERKTGGADGLRQAKSL